MEAVTDFTFLLIQTKNTDIPYKVLCMNGFGFQEGGTSDEAIDACYKEVRDMLKLYAELNLVVNLKTIYEYQQEFELSSIGLKEDDIEQMVWFTKPTKEFY